MKSDLFENRLNLSNSRHQIPTAKLNSGSVTNKYPVMLDDGKTVVFISDKSLERETRDRYAMRRK